MAWFKKREKTPEEIAEENKPEFSPEVQAVIDANPNSFFRDNDGTLHWVKIIPERDAEFGKKMKLGRVTLTKIMTKLQQTSTCELWCGRRNSANHYKHNEVQDLVDYAWSARHALDWMMKESVERGCGEYDSEGTFRFKGEGE